MTSKVTLSAKDHDGEGTSFGFYIGTLSAANFDASLAAVTSLQSLVNAITLGTFDGKIVKAVEAAPSAVPADPYAQREAKWRVNYTDDVNPLGNGSFEIGMPDLTKLSAGTGKADLTDVDVAAFVSAAEGLLVSRLGNAITITELVHVGRNI